MPLIPYCGHDGGAPLPEPASTSQASTEAIALRDAHSQIIALNARIRSLEGALQAAHRVLAPYARSTR
jgi:hypothetical protein